MTEPVTNDQLVLIDNGGDLPFTCELNGMYISDDVHIKLSLGESAKATIFLESRTVSTDNVSFRRFQC